MAPMSSLHTHPSQRRFAPSTNASSIHQQAAVYMAQTGKATMDKTRAALFLGMSVDHFHEHVEGRIPVVPSGRRRLYRVVDLLQWLEDNASTAQETVAA